MSRLAEILALGVAGLAAVAGAAVTPIHVAATSAVEAITGASFTDPMRPPIGSGAIAFDVVSVEPPVAAGRTDLYDLELAMAAAPDVANWVVLIGGFALIGAAVRVNRPAAVSFSWGNPPESRRRA